MDIPRRQGELIPVGETEFLCRRPDGSKTRATQRHCGRMGPRGKEATHKSPESPRGRIIRYFSIYNISKAVKDYCLILLKLELRYITY